MTAPKPIRRCLSTAGQLVSLIGAIVMTLRIALGIAVLLIHRGDQSRSARHGGFFSGLVD